jgi:hypothetical protein
MSYGSIECTIIELNRPTTSSSNPTWSQSLYITLKTRKSMDLGREIINDENNNIDDDNGIHDLPDELSDAETEQMGNTPYGIEVPTASTRARPPPRLIESINMAQAVNELAADYKCELTPAEERLYDAMRELNEMALIGAGIGGEFVNTEELRIMNYNEANKSEKDKWDYAVKEELARMTNSKVWEAVPIDKILEGTKIMTSAWAMKKKSNGTYQTRINARGFEHKSMENTAIWIQSHLQ